MTTINEGNEKRGGTEGPTAGKEEPGVARKGRGRVRRATFADLDAILDINDNIYDGTDYFPALFYVFMHSKQYATYVYELFDGKLVALSCFYFLPDVDDLVSIIALRVRPSFQGQGFGRPDQNPMMDQFRRDHPGVTRYSIQTLLTPNIQAKIHQRKLLYHWNVFIHRLTNRQHLEKFSILHQNANPRCRSTTLSYTEGTEWLTKSDKLVNFLSGYAEDYFVARVNWIPVRISATELRKLFTDNNIVVSFADTKSTSVGGKSILMSATDERSTFGEDDEIAGFSSSNMFQCKYGVVVYIHFYGDSEIELLSHVYSHMLHYVSVTQDDVRIACGLHFPLSIDSNSVRERLREELGETYESEHYSVNEVVEYMATFDTPL